MSEFEDKLRNALRPVDPGADFTSRVMQGVAEKDSPGFRLPARRPVPNWLPMALAASLVFAAVGAHYWQEHTERVQGLEAREQLLEALRVTSDKLEIAYDGVNSEAGEENAGV